MALTYSKRLCLLLNKNVKKNAFLSLDGKIQHLVPTVRYYKPTDASNMKLNKKVKDFLDKVAKSDAFMKEQIKEFERGKEFLAGMMGRNSKEMTQEDIDNAIEYLFPSALFVPRARPLMKPPHEIYGNQEIKEFDETGRPHHYLFYTLKPNFSQCLHDAAVTLERLNGLLYKKKSRPKPLLLVGGKWLNQLELKEKFHEAVYDIEYEKFLEIFNKLKEHPFAIEAQDFITSYWKVIERKEGVTSLPTVFTSDNLTVAVIEGVRRKTSTARVSVSNPGSGKIRINNMGIDYFISIGPREQVIFPLLFSDLLGKVDVDATVEGGGESSQGGAVRLGIARALEPFVTSDMFLEMKLAGLLQPDIRTQERKKPGREGARRRYTWLKR